jgi:hypothetical protein
VAEVNCPQKATMLRMEQPRSTHVLAMDTSKLGILLADT